MRSGPWSVLTWTVFRELRRAIYHSVRQMADVGTEIPIKWLRYEQVLQNILEKRVLIAHIDTASEVGRD